MKQQSEHLSNAQIEQYGKRASGAGPETEAWVDQHLDDCSSCRSRVLDFQRTRFALLPNQKVNTAPSSNCPSEDDLRTLAAGLYPDPKAAQLKAHAATCNRCGSLLQQYIEDFSDKSSPEEQAFLDRLRTSSPEFRQQKAREMFKREMLKKNPVIPEPVPSPDWRRFFSWKWIMVPATAAVAIATVIICGIVGFGVWYARRDTPEKVEALLAQAYPVHRTTEMRWPGTPWGEPRETLGPAILDQPRTLLAAKDAIQRQTPETLRRTEWLHLQAQSKILGGKPSKQLVEDLTKATQSRPTSQSLMFDLAIANFRMGEVADDRNYYLRAKTVLDEMLASFPPTSAALFDRGVAEERLQLRDQALADLTQCLTLESDPAWSAEIREKIKKLESLR